MPRKKPPQKIVEELCAFCQMEEEHPFLGPLVESGDIRAHSNCVYAASGLSQDKEDGKTDGEYIEGFNIAAVQKEIKRGRLLLCSHCHRAGATVGCVVGSCPRSFHLPCITKAGGITIFEDPFPTYCKRHAPKQDLEPWFRSNVEAPTCCICLFSILPEDSPPRKSPEHKQPLMSSAPIIIPPTPLSRAPEELRRPPRRSCVTVSTPKCVRISTTTSTVKRKLSFSNGSSTWELPDSPPKPDISELDKTLTIRNSCRKPTIANWDSLPAWLQDYLSSLSGNARSSAYDTWQHNTVHGLCCPKAWMHRACIAGFAVSAALHYVKCPYCADKQTFIRSIINAGIWVPDRDAAWELEPGAFADLAPVDEAEENGQSSSDSETSDSTHSRDSSRNASPNRSSPSGSISKHTHTDQPIKHEPRPTEANDLDPRQAAPPPPPAPTTMVDAPPPSTRITNHSKSVLPLVWPRETAVGTQRAGVGRPRSRRFTHQTAFTQKKSPPHSVVVTRRVRRRLSLHSRENLSIDSHVESRLRQVTLGTFLATFHMSPPAE